MSCWVLILVVRWVYRLVWTGVSLVIGILALAVGNTVRLADALDDAWELVKGAFYSAVGSVICPVIRVVT